MRLVTLMRLHRRIKGVAHLASSRVVTGPDQLAVGGMYGLVRDVQRLELFGTQRGATDTDTARSVRSA